MKDDAAICKHYMIKLLLTDDLTKQNIDTSLTLSDLSNNRGVTDKGIP